MKLWKEPENAVTCQCKRVETDNTCDLTSRFRAVNTSLLKVEDVELVFAPAMLSPSVPPHSYFHAFLAWSGSGSTDRLLAELGSHPFTCASFTWLRLHTSASPALSPVSSSAEPPCLKFPSWPNQLCLHSLVFKVSSRNTHLIKPPSPSPPIDTIKETDVKTKPPATDLLRHENRTSPSAQSLFLFKLYSHTIFHVLSI